MTDARHQLAYLMWCYQQGYMNVEDRGDNWMLEPDSALHVDDIMTKRILLAMADEVLAAMVDA